MDDATSYTMSYATRIAEVCATRKDIKSISSVTRNTKPGATRKDNVSFMLINTMAFTGEPRGKRK